MHVQVSPPDVFSFFVLFFFFLFSFMKCFFKISGHLILCGCVHKHCYVRNINRGLVCGDKNLDLTLKNN